MTKLIFTDYAESDYLKTTGSKGGLRISARADLGTHSGFSVSMEAETISLHLTHHW
jgi:hypothetical protein